MKPQLQAFDQGTRRPRDGSGFPAGILRLVKGSIEREAIAAGQVDAVIDPASGKVILLPDAQEALHQQQARTSGLLALAADWLWEQDEDHRFVSHTSAETGTPSPCTPWILGKSLWELGFYATSETDWDTHRQQLAWRATFRDFELEWTDGTTNVRRVSINGEPVFDADDQFKGYRGTMRDVAHPMRPQATPAPVVEPEQDEDTRDDELPLRLPLSVTKGAQIANKLLDSLPREDRCSLLSGLEQVRLTAGEVLLEVGKPIQYAYFPTDCLVSLQTRAKDSLSLEVGLVGGEGMVGVSLLLGSSVSSVRAQVIVTGGALRMTAARFRRAIRTSLPLQGAANRFVNAKLALARQTAACTRFHALEGRLAGWLLGTCDRIGSSDLHFTQDELASLLGVRRVGVTNAACKLERNKLITYKRGAIRILDREGLEAASCGCYRAGKDFGCGLLREATSSGR